MNEQQLRIGDAERDEAAAALGEHVAQGRLTPDEHGERLDQVWAARTRGDLAPLFADLPAPWPAAAAAAPPAGPPAPVPRSADPFARPGRAARRGPRALRGLPAPVLAVLVLLLVLTVLTHLPLIVLGGLAWFLVLGRHRRQRHLVHGPWRR